MPGKFDIEAADSYAQQVADLRSELEQLAAAGPIAFSSPAADLVQQLVTGRTRLSAADTFYFSDLFNDQLAEVGVVRSYFDRPRVTITTNRATTSDGDEPITQFGNSIDLRRDGVRVVAPPGQNVDAARVFRIARGMIENIVETEVAAFQVSQVPDAPPTVSTSRVLAAAREANVAFLPIAAENVRELDAVPFSVEAKTRISAAVNAGKLILVPQQPVEIGGADQLAWYEIDPLSGETVGVTEDGGHQAISEYASALAFSATGIGVIAGMVSYVDHITNCSGGNLQACKDQMQGNMANNLLAGGLTGLIPLPGVGAAVIGIFGLVSSLFEALSLVAARIAFDPPLPAQFISPLALDEFQDLVGAGVVVETVGDPLFTLPFGGAQLPTVFRVGIRNEQALDDRFEVQAISAPAGWEVLTSVPDIKVPSGQTAEVGLFLRPVGVLQPPGTNASFTVGVTSLSDAAVSDSFEVTFVVPEIHGVIESIEPPRAAVPGVPVEFDFLLHGIGNVGSDVTFDANLPAGLALDGLSPVTVNPGQSVRQTLALTPAVDMPLGTTLAVRITMRYGDVEPQMIVIPIRLAAPGADSLAQSAMAARDLGNAELAARLDDLSIALTNLVQDSANEVFRGQALASLDSILSLVAVDEVLVGFRGPLESARGALVTANTPVETQNAILQLGTALDDFAVVTAALSSGNAEVVLLPTSQVAQPLTPRVFTVRVRNMGTDTTTYDLGLSGLPPGVTAQFDTTPLSLQRGEVAEIPLTLTQTTTDELLAFEFIVDVSIAGVTPTISKSAIGTLRTRNEFLQVTSVLLDPPFVEPGSSVGVSARLLNAVHRQQDALVSYVVINPQGQEIFASAPAPTTLSVQTSLVTVDLGAFDTTGLELGQHVVRVIVTDNDGVPISGGAGQAALLVGSPVTAELTVAPQALPPGASIVTSTLQVDSQTPFFGAMDPVGQLSINGGSRGVVARHGVAYVSGPSGVRVVDVADPQNPVLVRTLAGNHLGARIQDNVLLALRGTGGSGGFVHPGRVRHS